EFGSALLGACRKDLVDRGIALCELAEVEADAGDGPCGDLMQPGSGKHVLRRQFSATGNVEDEIDALVVGNRAKEPDEALLVVGIAERVLVIDPAFRERHGDR